MTAEQAETLRRLAKSTGWHGTPAGHGTALSQGRCLESTGMSGQMEVSGRPTVMPNPELIAARGGAGTDVDPFFTNVKSELSDKGALSRRPMT